MSYPNRLNDATIKYPRLDRNSTLSKVYLMPSRDRSRIVRRSKLYNIASWNLWNHANLIVFLWNATIIYVLRYCGGDLHFLYEEFTWYNNYVVLTRLQINTDESYFFFNYMLFYDLKSLCLEYLPAPPLCPCGGRASSVYQHVHRLNHSSIELQCEKDGNIITNHARKRCYTNQRTIGDYRQAHQNERW